MLQKTEADTSEALPPGHLRRAGLAGLLVLTCIAGADAGDPARSAKPSSGPAWRHASTPKAGTPGSAAGTGNTARQQRSQKATPATMSRVLPAAAPSSAPVSQGSQTEVFQSQGAPEGRVFVQGTPRPVPQNSGYTDRMRSVLSGEAIASSMDSVGDWWEARSRQMFDRSLGGPTSVSGRLSGATQSIVSGGTRADDTVLEVDQFDAHPVAVVAPLQQDPGEVAAQPERSVSPGSRLKTDIRTIEPTLDYALRNVDPSQLPEDFNRKVETGDYVARTSSPTVFQWAPTNLTHHPLYFEDPALERYGHTYHPVVQPFASTGRFATQLVGLPYQMALHPLHSHEYALGYYRPGECAPKKLYQIPFNEEATLVQAATIVGLILIIP